MFLLAYLAASAIAGILWSAISPTAAFLYAAGWMALALTGLTLTQSAQPTKT